MSIPTAAWFGHKFRKEDGARFREDLRALGYDNPSFMIKNEKQIKLLIESLLQDKIESKRQVTFILSNFFWEQHSEENNKGGFGFFSTKDEFKGSPFEMLMESLLAYIYLRDKTAEITLGGISSKKSENGDAEFADFFNWETPKDTTKNRRSSILKASSNQTTPRRDEDSDSPVGVVSPEQELIPPKKSTSGFSLASSFFKSKSSLGTQNQQYDKLELSVYPPGIPAILSQNLFTVHQKYKNPSVRKLLLKKLNSVCREHIYDKDSDWIFIDILVTKGRTHYANIKLQIFPSMMKLEQFLQLVDPEFMPKKLNATFDEALANLIFFNDSDTIALYLFQDDYPTEQEITIVSRIQQKLHGLQCYPFDKSNAVNPDNVIRRWRETVNYLLHQDRISPTAHTNLALEVEKEAQKQKSLSKTIEGQEQTIEELNANIDKLSEEKEQLEKTITEKDEQIEKYAAQLKFYEDKLGFTRQDRTVPVSQKVAEKIERDNPVSDPNHPIEQPLDEKRLWLQAQHAENLDVKYLEQRIIAFTNTEIRLRTELDNYQKREVVFKNAIEDLEADMAKTAAENRSLKLELRKIIHNRAAEQLAITDTKKIDKKTAKAIEKAEEVLIRLTEERLETTLSFETDEEKQKRLDKEREQEEESEEYLNKLSVFAADKFKTLTKKFHDQVKTLENALEVAENSRMEGVKKASFLQLKIEQLEALSKEKDLRLDEAQEDLNELEEVNRKDRHKYKNTLETYIRDISKSVVAEKANSKELLVEIMDRMRRDYEKTKLDELNQTKMMNKKLSLAIEKFKNLAYKVIAVNLHVEKTLLDLKWEKETDLRADFPRLADLVTLRKEIKKDEILEKLDQFQDYLNTYHERLLAAKKETEKIREDNARSEEEIRRLKSNYLHLVTKTEKEVLQLKTEMVEKDTTIQELRDYIGIQMRRLRGYFN